MPTLQRQMEMQSFWDLHQQLGDRFPFLQKYIPWSLLVSGEAAAVAGHGGGRGRNGAQQRSLVAVAAGAGEELGRKASGAPQGRFGKKAFLFLIVFGCGFQIH